MTQERRLLLAIGSISTISLFGIWLLAIRYLPETLDHLTRSCNQSFLMFMNDPMHFIGLAAGGAATTVMLIGVFTFLATLQKSKRMLAGLRSTKRSNLPPEVLSLAKRQGIDEGAIELVDSPNPLAFCHGVLRRRILVSTGLLASLSPKELEAVVIHEACHFRKHHPRMILIGKLFARSFFFIPIIKELSRLLDTLIEINADRAVILAQRSATHLRQALGKSLQSDPLPATVALRDTPLETRIAFMTSPLTATRLRISRSSLAFTLLIISALSLLLASAPQAEAKPSNSTGACLQDTCQAQCESLEPVTESAFYTPASLEIRY